MAKAKKRPSGNWNVLVYVGKGSDGKREYRSVTAPSKKEAEYKAAEIRMRSTPSARMTLREAYERYVNSKRNTLSPSTLKEYDRVCKASAYPIMNKEIGAIRTEDVQRVVDDLARSHSPKTVRNRYGLFTAVMRMFAKDSSFDVTLPDRIAEDVYIPEPKTIRRLGDLLAGHWLYVPFLLASQRGLRASEIAGLQYKYVLDDKIIVCQARVASSDGPVLREKTKTVSGRRTVPLNAYIRHFIGTGKPDSFVVPYSAWQISDAWGDFMRDHPEETYFSFHKLRHYFASQALLLGIPKRYVADMMGHSSEHMLDRIYEHVFPSARTQFYDRLTSFFDEMQDEMQDENPKPLDFQGVL